MSQQRCGECAKCMVNNFEPEACAASVFEGSLIDDRTHTNLNIAGLTYRTSWADTESTWKTLPP